MAELRLADVAGPVAVGKVWGKSLCGFPQGLEMQSQVRDWPVIVGEVWVRTVNADPSWCI